MNEEWVEVYSVYDLMPGDEILATIYNERQLHRAVIEKWHTEGIYWAIEKTTGTRVLINDDVLYKVKINKGYMTRRCREWYSKK